MNIKRCLKTFRQVVREGKLFGKFRERSQFSSEKISSFLWMKLPTCWFKSREFLSIWRSKLFQFSKNKLNFQCVQHINELFSEESKQVCLSYIETLIVNSSENRKLAENKEKILFCLLNVEWIVNTEKLGKEKLFHPENEMKSSISSFVLDKEERKEKTKFVLCLFSINGKVGIWWIEFRGNLIWVCLIIIIESSSSTSYRIHTISISNKCVADCCCILAIYDPIK